MSLPTFANLTDLPHELLTKIINPLSKQSIYALSKTCKTLHFFALPRFLSEDGVHIGTHSPDYVLISKPSQEGWSALGTSLLAGNLRSIKFSATVEEVDRLLPDIRALQRLLERLPSVFALTLVYHTYCDEVDYEALDDADLDMQELSTEFSALLDTALQKSCQDLSISGGDNILNSSFFEPDLQERHAPKFWKTLKGTACRKALSIFSNTKNQPEPSHPLTASQCSSFHLESSMLLHPRLLCWTQSTLQANAGALTRLKFNKVDSNVTSADWHQLLPTLALPSLEEFELTLRYPPYEGRGVALRDIEAFLKHHPSIQILKLSGIVIPYPIPRLRKPILPQLHTVEANPIIIARLLFHTVAYFRKLKSVTMAWGFDYDEFDEALEAIAHYSQADALCLRFKALPENGLHKWMEKHTSTSMGPSGSPIGRIANRVTDLTIHIQTNHWTLGRVKEPMVSQQLLSQFLALFSSLDKANFGEQMGSGEFYLQGCEDLFKKVMSLCPGFQTVLVNGKVVGLAHPGV